MRKGYTLKGVYSPTKRYTFLLKKNQYLLRDIEFELRTDHRNLIYINDHAGTSNKILNWKLEIQQHNMNIKHIDGIRNVVADIWSRICSLTPRDIENNDNLQQQEDQLSQYNYTAHTLAALTPNRVTRGPRRDERGERGLCYIEALLLHPAVSIRPQVAQLL